MSVTIGIVTLLCGSVLAIRISVMLQAKIPVMSRDAMTRRSALVAPTATTGRDRDDVATVPL